MCNCSGTKKSPPQTEYSLRDESRDFQLIFFVIFNVATINQTSMWFCLALHSFDLFVPNICVGKAVELHCREGWSRKNANFCLFVKCHMSRLPVSQPTNKRNMQHISEIWSGTEGKPILRFTFKNYYWYSNEEFSPFLCPSHVRTSESMLHSSVKITSDFKAIYDSNDSLIRLYKTMPFLCNQAILAETTLNPFPIGAIFSIDSDCQFSIENV